ncbi:response regulator transcription factor [Fodinicola acaciae]|uniref:response regulator transcription factor n=1 Tax=Fodinicola acaciae TaxID=2681555 RepID=UPI0013D63EBF|nr:response regulator transcription factor [Fodinicola acaciae]
MVSAPRILVVDDDPTVRDVMRRYLSRAGYEVTVRADGEAAMAEISAKPPDLVVLDLMLPGLSGLEVCEELRRHSSIPVIMLTALGEEEDRVAGLETGADDYVTKPFSPRELVLRVGSVLRRSAGPPDPRPAGTVTDGDLSIDLDARRVSLRGRELSLTTREFDLLAYFVRHPGQVFRRPELLERVWGWSFGDQSTVTVHVRRLREKLETDPVHPRRLATVWGVGYRYDPQEPVC